MSTPAHETIMDAAFSRLSANITTANGYSTESIKEKLSTLTPFEGDDFPAISLWPLEDSQTKTAYKKTAHVFGFIVGYFDKVDAEGATAYAEQAARLGADVITAINRATALPAVSDSKSLNLGGLVSSLDVVRLEYSTGTGQVPWCGVLIEFAATYNSPSGDPYTIEV